SHADYAWQCKYGLRDWRGGGRASGRETVSRVVAGAVAAGVLATAGVEVSARVVAIGGQSDPSCFAECLRQAAAQADSVGGIVECRATGVPAGWGEPSFGKLQQMLAGAMLSIGGVKGFEYGDGFAMASATGSQANDPMRAGRDGEVCFCSNHSGGIQGGISNGQEIVMRVAFKPTPTIGMAQHTVDAAGHDVVLEAGGRHDPCVAVRGAVVVEAMAAMVLCDAMLMSRGARL
ncbi:MAG: chorismate synthase, partial [Muribaculaceae bacterium]|nr:chorismate synthase [Muribaculaceae bacterium]